MSTDKVFYIVMTAFLSFFGAFAGIICKQSSNILYVLMIIDPNRLFLHPNGAADYLASVLPVFFLVN